VTKIAGIVILYNPSMRFVENINSYVNQVDTLFALDNSELAATEFVQEISRFKNVYYKWNGGNIGVARALNIGAQLALDQRYDFLLMMDQDSTISENAISEYNKFILFHGADDLGILYPYHSYRNYFRKRKIVPFEEILVADTSGSLLNLSAYCKVGQFLEKLFIDYVDFEYCLRLQLNGFNIIQLNMVTLFQELGEMDIINLLFLKISITNHSAQRFYYRVRNRLFVSSKYFIYFPLWSMKQFVYVMIEFVKVILFEQNKITKCRMIGKAILHFMNNTYGVLRQDY